MRRITSTIAALAFAGAVCVPVVAAGPAAAAECPPQEQPKGGGPVPTPPTPAGALVGSAIGALNPDQC
jgi:hypothetical protein